RVFQCPADTWVQQGGGEGMSGYRIFNNVTNLPGGPYFPISYGCNADILAVSDASGQGRFGLSDNMAVVGGPKPQQGSSHGGVSVGPPVPGEAVYVQRVAR